MKRHLAAWIVAVGLISSGMGLAACEPQQEDNKQPTQYVCIRDGEPC